MTVHGTDRTVWPGWNTLCINSQAVFEKSWQKFFIIIKSERHDNIIV